MQGFVRNETQFGAQVYTDDARAYQGINRPHESVQHSVGEYVRDMAHTNGMESFWSMLKRGYNCTYHYWSFKHTDRYISEFSGRYNQQKMDTEEQMENKAKGTVGKHPPYAKLAA